MIWKLAGHDYIGAMKHLVLALCLVCPVSVSAQQEGDIDEGFSLMEEGAKLLFRGIISEMEPAMDDLTGMARDLEPALDMLASEIGPALMEMMQAIDSIQYYEAPEVLPNGDIIIRRRSDAPEFGGADADRDVIDL